MTPGGVIEGCTLGIPGWVNIENAVAAVASVWCAAERDGDAARCGTAARGAGVVRGRQATFRILCQYAPAGLHGRLRPPPARVGGDDHVGQKMFPGRRMTALFQPHLYTRTRDLYREFAEALSHADHVVLLPIYPAREEPIPGGIRDDRPSADSTLDDLRPGGVGRYGGGDGHRRSRQLRCGQHRRLLRGDRRKAESEELAGRTAAGAHVRRAGCKNRRRRNDG